MNDFSIHEIKKHKIQNFVFQCMLSKFEIILMRIGQIIKLQNEIEFSKTPVYYYCYKVDASWSKIISLWNIYKRDKYESPLKSM